MEQIEKTVALCSLLVTLGGGGFAMIIVAKMNIIALLQKMERLADQVVNDLLNPQIKEGIYHINGVGFSVSKSESNIQERIIGEYTFSIKYAGIIEVTLWKNRNIVYCRRVDITV